jgi:DNA transposition AAA+ family ATPase
MEAVAEPITSLQSPVTSRVHDYQLIEQIRALAMPQTELAAAFGVSNAVISTWLKGKYTGDVEGLENRARSYLDTLALQANAPKAQQGFLDTAVAQRMFGILERIQETRDLGLATGPAGAGKTQACLKYRELKPTVIYLCVLPWARDIWSVQKLLVRAISQRRDERRDMDWVVEKLTNSNRLLIIDDAHELDRSGYKLVIKVHDETNIPVALVGNECMVDDIEGTSANARRRQVQLISRVGLRLAVERRDKHGSQRELYRPEDVAALCRQHVGKPSRALLDLCVWAANLPGHGHMRTLVKVLRNTAKMIQSSDDEVVAFQKSWAMLKRDVNLPEAA